MGFSGIDRDIRWGIGARIKRILLIISIGTLLVLKREYVNYQITTDVPVLDEMKKVVGPCHLVKWTHIQYAIYTTHSSFYNLA